MKIGIIGAMEKEVTLLNDKIENSNNFSLGSCEFYTGTLNGIEVALLKSGIGKVAAAFSTALLLERYHPNIIINIGSAGSLTKILEVGNIIISSEVCYYDTDVTAFGYEYGQLPNYPLIFKADKKLITIAKDCVAKLNIKVMCGLIVSGDTFINSAARLAEICYKFPKAIAVEMESAAIAQVCYNFKIPFVVVRAISDVVNQHSHISFDKNLIVATNQSTIVVEKMVQKLASS